MPSVASAHHRSATRTVRIGLRATPQQEELLRLGAEASRKSLTDFILDSASRAAEDALLDQRLFFVSGEKYDEVLAQHDQPSQDNPGLRDLFSRPEHWDNA